MLPPWLEVETTLSPSQAKRMIAEFVRREATES